MSFIPRGAIYMSYIGYPYQRRWRRRGFRGLPFILFFIILFAGHSFVAFLVGIAVAIAVSILLAALFRAGSSNMPPTAQTYYHPPQQQYQPYEQGYQPPEPVKYPEANAPYQPPQAQSRYEEQPQAEYPQELPPMEQ